MSDQQPVFSIDKVYVKDASTEVPNAPQVFLEAVQPQLEVQLGSSAGRIGDGLYEAVVTMTITAKAGEKTCFLVEVRRPAFSRSATCRTPTSTRSSVSPARTSSSPTPARRSPI